MTRSSRARASPSSLASSRRPAGEGDESAQDLLDQAARHLARAARAVERKLSFRTPIRSSCPGGAFRACPSLVRRIEVRLDDLPQARIARLEVEPAVGAITLALELLRAGDRPEAGESGRSA